jgi:molybdenum ABC transporter molybdate-binding protein
MFGRFHPAWFVVGGSVMVLALMGLLLWSPWSQTSPIELPWNPPTDKAPLRVLAAASLRKPLEAIARDYEKEQQQKVELIFGPSQQVLTQLELARQGGQTADLFAPADEIYIDMAREKGLIGDVFPLARMTAVVAVRADSDKKIESWNDLAAEGMRVAVADRAAAIGKLTEDQLGQKIQWAMLKPRIVVKAATVNQVADVVYLKTADAGIVWDATAKQYPDLKAVSLAELKPITAKVQMAIAAASPRQAAAHAFARYVAANDKGQVHFRDNGFGSLEDHGKFGGKRPRIVLLAGAMLKPAIEKTLKEFSEREGVDIDTSYNGCGILVGQMQAGLKPDVYFSCDPRFMTMVQDMFEKPEIISSNQLVIAVPKGNPHHIQSTADLGKTKMRVGVGHEQQCALGAITKETFIAKGTYAALRANVVVEAPAGDQLINQLRLKALDAVVAYQSNVEPFKDEIDAIPIKDVACAAPQQPIAIAKSTAHKEVVERLIKAIRSAESRERFTSQGFGWAPKP